MNYPMVLKRRGRRRSEPFDGEKLLASIKAACLSVRLTDGVAHDTAVQAVKRVEDWAKDKSEVTSADIRRITGETLSRVSPEAGYLYQHHKIIM